MTVKNEMTSKLCFRIFTCTVVYEYFPVYSKAMALFGDGGGRGKREPRSLVEFRAGKMKLSGTTVSADIRKGLVYMRWDTDENLLHFCWKDRQNGKLEDVSHVTLDGDGNTS